MQKGPDRMKYCRFAHNGRVHVGRIEGDRVIPTGSSGFEAERATGPSISLDAVTLLVPCDPSKIVLVSKNYRERILATGYDLPETPLLFLKPTSALVGSNAVVVIPPTIAEVSCELELAVVIGKTVKSLSASEAADSIFGYSLLFDISARDIVTADIQLTRGKSYDTFAPLGPWISTAISPDSLHLQLYQNGELVVDTSTADMVFPVFELVSFISHVMTLYPGDVISTGGAGPFRPLLRAGDELRGVGHGIGTLEVSVAASDA